MPAAELSPLAGNKVQIYRDLTYVTVDGWNGKLDVLVPPAPKPRATVLRIPSRAWLPMPKDRAGMDAGSLPFLEMGFTVVNISYRTADIATGLAAFEDSRCALRWIVRNADTYGFDRRRIVLWGAGGGGLVALTTGMATAEAGLDGRCPDPESIKVAAIINQSGWTSIPEILDGPGRRDSAVRWFGTAPNIPDIAVRVSPVSLVRPDGPPILTIHGDADATVPYSHATRLHAALAKAGATNELFTLPNAGHGPYNDADQRRAVAAMRSFLSKHGICQP